MTKKEIDLISSRGQGTYKQVYYDELGNRYIGLINGRIVRDQVSVANIATTATTAENAISSAATSTTPSITGIIFLNGLNASNQTFATGTAGIDFNISSSLSTHTFNIPDASATARGLITTGVQTIAGIKTFTSNPIFSSLTQGSVLFAGSGGLLSQSNADFFWDNSNKRLGIGTATPSKKLEVNGDSLINSFTVGRGNSNSIYNIAFGKDALVATTTGNRNVGVGYEALKSITYQNYNTAVGYSSLVNNIADKNTAFGSDVLTSNTTGIGNVGIGVNSLNSNQTGNYNIAIDSNTGGLRNNVSGSGNISIGSYSLHSQIGVSYSVGIGWASLYSNVSGVENSAVGYSALYNATNSKNTAFGYNAGNAITTGNSNTFIGAYADSTVAGVVNATAIGYNTKVSQSNTVILGSNSAFVGIGTSTPSYMLDVNGTARIQNKLTLGNSIIASGTSEGTSGQVLTSNGTGAIPSWTTITGTGTVTSVSALTLTTTGTDLTSTVANSTTTPVITLNVPTASATNRGALSSTDWTTFNNKQAALTLTTTGTSGAATLVGSTLNIPQYSGGGMSIGGSITSATAGSVLFAGTSGVLAQDNSNLFWDNTNKRLGIATASPTHKLHVSGSTTASAASAIGVQLTPTLVASANGDVLTALNISPTFTNGGFTGLSNIGLRINNAFTLGVNASSGSGEIKALTTNVDFLGLTGNTGSFNFYGGGAYNTGAGVTVGGSSHATYANVIAFWRSGFVQNARFTTNGNLILGTGTADAGYKLDNSGTSRLQGLITLSDGVNLTVGSTNGTKIGQSSTEKLGFWNVTPIVQPTTATTAATRLGGGGTALTDTDTFDGYTIAKVVKALRNAGILQ